MAVQGYWQNVHVKPLAKVVVIVVVLVIAKVIVTIVVETAIITVPAVQVVVKVVKAAAMDVQVHAQGVPTVQQFVKVGIEVAVKNVMVHVVQLVPIVMVIVGIVAQVSVRPAVKVRAKEIVKLIVLETAKANAQIPVQPVQAIVRANAKVAEVVAKKIVLEHVQVVAPLVVESASAVV